MGKLETLKKSLFLLVFLTFSFNIYSQQDTLQSNNDSSQNISQSEYASDKLIGDLFGDSPSDNQEDNNSQKSKQNSGFGWAIFKIILVLILIISAIYGVMFFFKKKSNAYKTSDDFLRRVSSLNFAPGKSIEIITLLEKGYMLGVTDSNINLIAEIDDKELIQALNLNFDKKYSTKKPSSFADVLDIFMPNGPREKKSIYEDAENKVSKMSSKNDEGENEQN